MGLFGEIALLLVLVAGTVLGSVLSRRAFGNPRGFDYSAAEFAVYVVLLAVFATSVFPAVPGDFLLAAIYFAAGLISSIVAGFASTLGGTRSDKGEPRSLEELAQKRAVAEHILHALLDAGMPRPNCSQCLLNCGFAPEMVDKLLVENKRHPAPHPLAKEVALLEEQLLEIEYRLKKRAKARPVVIVQPPQTQQQPKQLIPWVAVHGKRKKIVK